MQSAPVQKYAVGQWVKYVYQDKQSTGKVTAAKYRIEQGWVYTLVSSSNPTPIHVREEDILGLS